MRFVMEVRLSGIGIVAIILVVECSQIKERYLRVVR
jgi:hypothetical protein